MSENAESRAIRALSPDLINGMASEIHSILDIAYSKDLIGPEQQGNSFVPSRPSDKARLFVNTIESRVSLDPSAYKLFLSILKSRPELKYLAKMLEDKRKELSSGDEPRAKIEKSEQTDSGAVVDPSHTLTEDSSQTTDGGDAVAGAANGVQPKLEPADPALKIPAQESCENLIKLSQNAPTEASDGDEPSTHSSQPSLYSNGACGTGDADSIYFSAKTEPTAGVLIAGAPDDSSPLDTKADNTFPVQETRTSHKDVVRQKVRTDSRSRLMSGDLSSSDDALDDMEDAVNTVHDELRAGAAKMRRKLKERKRQVVVCNEKIRELEEEVIARQCSEETLQAKLTEQSRENERLEYLVFEKTMESTRMKHKHSNEVKDLKTELSEKDKEVDSCKSQMAQMEKDNTAKIEDLETKIQALEDERVAVKSHNESVQKQHEIEITKLKHELELKKAEMTKVENERDSINNKLEKTELAYERKMFEHEKEIISLKSELILMKNCKVELECEKLRLELKLKDTEHEKDLETHRKNSVSIDVHEKTLRELEDLTKRVNVAELSETFSKATI